MKLWRFQKVLHKWAKKTVVQGSVVKNIDISINIDTEISERYQY